MLQARRLEETRGELFKNIAEHVTEVVGSDLGGGLAVLLQLLHDLLLKRLGQLEERGVDINE